MTRYRSFKGLLPYFYGIRGVYFMYRGSTSDPQVYYKGKVVDYYDVETPVWEEYKEICRESGVPADEGEPFARFVRSRADEVKEIITVTGKLYECL